MKIAIVDDDVYFLNLIKNKLLYLDHNLALECYQDPYEFIERINDFNYVLLDIEMPEIDGISLAKQLRNNIISIFFITSHEELMIKAFGKNVEGFILKDDLDDGINKFYQFLIDQQDKQCIEINTYYHTNKIYFDEIMYVIYTLRDIEYYLNNNEIIIQKNTTLKDVIDLLNDDFILINRTTLVNIKYISKFKNGNLYIRNKNFTVSRRKIKDVKIKLFERRFDDGYSL